MATTTTALARTLLGLAALLPGAVWAASTPVSPGSADGFTRIANGCPTFSWTAGEPDRWQQLVVLRVGSGSTGRESALTPVLGVEPPAGATSWTPALDQCLEPGLYAWQLRGTDLKRPPVPLLFEVAEEEADLEAAVHRLELYLEEGGSLDELLHRQAPPPQAVESDSTESHEVAEVRSPLSRLSSDDMISASAFRYTTPRTYIHRVTGDKFFPGVLLGPGSPWRRPSQSIHTFSATNIPGEELHAKVSLPEAATVTRLTCYHLDDDSNDSAIWATSLERRLPATGSGRMALVTNDSAGQSPTIRARTTTAITDPVVANEENSYVLLTFYTHDFGTSGYLPNLRFFGCDIEYQLSEPSAH